MRKIVIYWYFTIFDMGFLSRQLWGEGDISFVFKGILGCLFQISSQIVILETFKISL